VVVELNLFCPFYEDSQWLLSPFHPANNVNDLGHVSRTNVYTLDKHGGLLPVQERMVRKMVEELQSFDNLYYEICNEPYFGGVTLAWQQHIASVIQEAQRDHAHPKLISQNIANNTARVHQPDPNVSILNFHYASPPDAVAMNYHHNKVIGDNETGFRGTKDLPYRIEAWEFILAGGGLFNHLDYSFVAGHEDGTFEYPKEQPGGGNPGYRKQLRILVDFMRSLEFIRMKPDKTFVKAVQPGDLKVHALSEPGRKSYAMYLRAPSPGASPTASIELELPQGNYAVEWVDTKSGAVLSPEKFQHSAGGRRFAAPAFTDDIALRVKGAD
jgi:hypothetical protein